MRDPSYLEMPPSGSTERVGDFFNAVMMLTPKSIPEDTTTFNKPERHFHVVEFAKQYILKNFSTKLDVEQIARKAFVSQYHFSRIFKKYTDSSPYQYLLEVRLQHARKLMNGTDLPIKEISFQSGFNSIDYFSAAFTKKYKICPREYRKLLFWHEKKNRR
ncbi:MAG: helix-turn-helix transcriptional regulator [Chitinophagaceae bacterium]|nr:helix-turn-helix transcriptional regulator [Chitinophagaceae bacterium]